jgi:phosphoglycerate dehydrogenase-like enzyme
MAPTVAIYDKAYEAIKPRLDALGLDLSVVPFTREAEYLVGGKAAAPEDVAVDYLWLSPMISAEKLQQVAFDMALRTKKVGVLQTFNAGLDDPFYKKLSDKGARICNSSAQSVAISEYVMAHVMSLVHPIALQADQQKRKHWQVTPFREISQTTWLILGFGPIGQAIAKRVKAFGAKTIVVRRTPQTSDIVDTSGTTADLPELLPQADVIVIACPLNAETRGLAGKAFFDAVKPGALLVNIARGAIIDDKALMAALDAGRLEHAVLDVFHTEPLPQDDPLWTHPKVRVTPHTSFGGNGTRGRWDQLFLDNIARFAKGEPLQNVVDPASLV